MSILNKQNLQIGQSVEIEVNKLDLAAVSVIAAHSHFSDSNNWKELVLFYTTPDDLASKVMSVDMTQPTPKDSIALSAQFPEGVNALEIQRMVLKNFDGGQLPIERVQLSGAELVDLDLVIAPNELLVFSRDYTERFPQAYSLNDEVVMGGQVTFLGKLVLTIEPGNTMASFRYTDFSRFVQAGKNYKLRLYNLVYTDVGNGVVSSMGFPSKNGINIADPTAGVNSVVHHDHDGYREFELSVTPGYSPAQWLLTFILQAAGTPTITGPHTLEFDKIEIYEV